MLIHRARATCRANIVKAAGGMPANIGDVSVDRSGFNDFVDEIPQSTQVMALTGARNRNTKSILTKEYIENVVSYIRKITLEEEKKFFLIVLDTLILKRIK